MIIWYFRRWLIGHYSDIELLMEFKRRKGRLGRMLEHDFWTIDDHIFKHLKGK